MKTPLERYAAEHRYLVATAARRAGFARPVAVNLSGFWHALRKRARKGELLPVDGVLLRHWDAYRCRTDAGALYGMRLYTIDGVRFAHVSFDFSQKYSWGCHNFVVVDRADYQRLYRIALRCRRDAQPPAPAPVLPAEQAQVLWKNTIDFLDPANLRRIQAYGGRAKRGVLLTGAPGNGKSMACRWIWEECRRRGWEYHLITPDNYRRARCDDTVEMLFSVERCGILFFDDMDLALRDRETMNETEDQAVFLSALDGLNAKEGLVFVFTTNCSLDLIDRAFKRPGRIDVVLHFGPPDAALRRQLMDRWHPDIRAQVDLDAAVASTEGHSFAEIEELKNLLVMRFLDRGDWDWGWAQEQFAANRQELAAEQRRVGFDRREPGRIGAAHGV
jgi:hypothetical protein